MKLQLKLVVASMSLLGFISGSVFAADTTTADTTAADTTKTETTKVVHHHHHKKVTHEVTERHHHHHHHHMMAAEGGYKGEMMAQPMMEMPRVDTYQVIYDAMGQNIGRPTVGAPDWFNRVSISGGVNFDGHWGNRSIGYNGENDRLLSLNDAYLNASAIVNDWTKGFMSLSYNNASDTNGRLGGVYDNAYPVNVLTVEQAYATFSNYSTWPIFIQLGKQYSDYGRYVIHPVTRTLAQVMSESLQTSAKFGFIVPMGFHGQVYTFSDSLHSTTNSHNDTIWGVSLGLDQPNDQLGYDIGVGYMNNLTGVNDIAASLAGGTYHHKVGGVSVYGDINTGPFSLGARYTSATQRFNAADLSTVRGVFTGSGAQPWAADVTAGYGFNVFTRPQNIYVGYQASGNAAGLLIPRSRWLAGYGVDMWKNVTLGAEYGHDMDYSSGNGGTGTTSNTIAGRAAVKFG